MIMYIVVILRDINVLLKKVHSLEYAKILSLHHLNLKTVAQKRHEITIIVNTALVIILNLPAATRYQYLYLVVAVIH